MSADETFFDTLYEASRNLSRQAAAAIDDYVLEQGPLRIEHSPDGSQVRIVAKQSVRLRLKTDEERRNAVIEECARAVEGSCIDGMHKDVGGRLDNEWVVCSDCAFTAGLIRALAAGVPESVTGEPCECPCHTVEQKGLRLAIHKCRCSAAAPVESVTPEGPQ